MFNAEQYIQDYQQMEHGAPRLRAIKTAIQAADEAKDTEWRFRFRHRLLNESTFESDVVDALVIFPEMIAIYDASAELQEDPENQEMLMWSFKLVIENALDFHHIPLEKIEEFFAEYSRRLETYGYSKRTYLYLREVASRFTGNLMPESEYGKYRREPEDALKDCAACELSHDVQMQLLFAHPEKADAMCKPIFDGSLHCGNVPDNTYAAWIEYNIRHGEYDDSRTMAKQLYAIAKQQMDDLPEISTLLRYYAAVSHHMGTLIFRHELPNFIACRNHRSRFMFAAGAYQLFRQMKDDSLVLILPTDFALYREDFHYQTSELRDYFYEEAKTLAEKFDARNGNTYMTDYLQAELPPYEKDANDLIHGDAEQSVSVIGAVCSTLPEELTVDSVTRKLQQDGRYVVLLSKADEEQGMLAFQIGVADGSHDIYQLAILCQPVPDYREFRPASPVSDESLKAVESAEGTVVFLMPFEEKQPDIALHMQLKFANLLCPEAVAYLDYSRMKMLPATWVLMAARSEVPPMVDYLYNLELHGTEEDDHLWITTRGLRTCGLREIEILDATKENYGRYCDMLSFAVERILLREELTDAKKPFTVVYKSDNSPVVCTWVPVSEARADYADGTEAGWAVRTKMLGDDAAGLEGNAVLYLYDGEAADGTPKRKRLNVLGEDDFKEFCYGSYIVTSRKIEALAQERIGILTVLMAKEPDRSFACVRLRENSEEEVWLHLTSVSETEVEGTLTVDCAAGKTGDLYKADVSQLTDFSVKVDDNLIIHPNTAYIALDLAT